MEKIPVIAYAGYRGEETPRAFIRKGKRVRVWKILDRWIEAILTEKGIRRCFRVKGDDSKRCILCFDEDKGEWFCKEGPVDE